MFLKKWYNGGIKIVVRVVARTNCLLKIISATGPSIFGGKKYMCHSNCDHKWGGCTISMIGKILLLVGGINWGLIGVGMLMSSDWNVVKMIFSSVPVIEAIIYILVGVAAIMKIFGCKCRKCMAVCASCGTDNKAEGSM